MVAAGLLKSLLRNPWHWTKVASSNCHRPSTSPCCRQCSQAAALLAKRAQNSASENPASPSSGPASPGTHCGKVSAGPLRKEPCCQAWVFKPMAQECCTSSNLACSSGESHAWSMRRGTFVPAVMQVASLPQSAQPALRRSLVQLSSCSSALRSPPMKQEPLPSDLSSSKVPRIAPLSCSFWLAVGLDTPYTDTTQHPQPPPRLTQAAANRELNSPTT